MTTAEAIIAEEPGQFIKQYADGYHCLELLRFFGRYPYTQFSELAVVHALDSNGGKLYIKKALGQLVDKGMVRMSVDNNISLYSLTEDESFRSLASKLAKLDWCQWRLALRQTLPTLAK